MRSRVCPRIPANESDLDILARTIWGEAEGEPWLGKVAVAWVVRNRWLRRSWYGQTIGEICTKARQFSCWSDQGRAAQMAALSLDDPVLQECYLIGLAVVLGRLRDPTGGATHFLNLSALKTPPRWYNPNEVTRKIGNHTFLKTA
ncbi:MAG: cell wall hydrolase [Candidatus Binatia bacterium]|nr:cell wall hydrolase [Candidatus Binatia bacterium]